MRKTILLATMLAWLGSLMAQTSFISGNINFYAAVTAVNYCNNSITINNAFPFNVGNRVVIIQMKGGVIDTTNTAAFGNVLNYNNAGKYEFATIMAKQGSVITLSKTLLNNYDIGQGVQLVRVPVYTNATVTGTVACSAWNGQTGGVLAMEVSGTLTMNAPIDASGRGYRPGVSVSKDTCCWSASYYYPQSTGNGGGKGESFTTLSNDKNAGKGKNANGGGGGNMHNAGGAGGGGLGAGGQSGFASSLGGTNVNAFHSAGVGGLGFDYMTNRLFFGGGGGNGHYNNFQNYAGARGGGIILINTTNLQCNGNTITADGQDSQVDSIPSTDGLPGGGGGGVVLLDVGTYLDTLRVSVKGGVGGSNLAGPSFLDGTGGGGGGGVILFTAIAPSPSILNTNGGAAGFSSGAGNSYGAAPGQPGGIRNNWIPTESNIDFVSLDSVQVTANTPLCEGEILTLSATDYPGVTYTWAGPNSFSSNEQYPELTMSSLTAGTYTLTVTRGDCTANPDFITVVMIPASFTSVSASICDGESYTLPDGTLATATDVYPVALVAANGCDSTVTTTLTVHPVFNQSFVFDLCDGETFTLPNGNSVSATGSYPVTLQTQFGCDSTIVSNVTFHVPITTNRTDTICWEETAILPDGQTANETGSFTSILTDMYGCDSFVVTHLYEYPELLTNVETYVCYGETYTLPNGQVVNTTGLYTSVITASTGCDSTVVTDLTVRDLPIIFLQYTICLGDTHILPNGTQVTISGSYPVVLTDIYGCDSLVNTNLSVIQPVFSYVNTYICSDATYTLPDGSQVSDPGTYQTTLPSAATGCDSIVVTTLDVIQVPTTMVNDTICQGEILTYHGQDLTESGIYIDTLNNYLGCDSIVTLDLFVIPISVDLPADISINLGDSVVVNGNVLPDGVPLDILMWTPDTLCDGCYDFTFYPIRSMTVSLLVQSTRGCTAEDQMSITVSKVRRIYVPNIFTPNGDNTNDALVVFCGPDVRRIKRFEVYNRWGSKVHSVSNVLPGDPALTWSGITNGADQPSEVYVWFIEAEFIDNETDIVKGDVTILR